MFENLFHIEILELLIQSEDSSKPMDIGKAMATKAKSVCKNTNHFTMMQIILGFIVDAMIDCFSISQMVNGRLFFSNKYGILVCFCFFLLIFAKETIAYPSLCASEHLCWSFITNHINWKNNENNYHS